MQNPYDEQLRSVDAEIEDLRKKRERAVSELVRISVDLTYANITKKRRREVVKQVSSLAGQIHVYDAFTMQELLAKRHDLETKRYILEYVRVKQ